MLKPTPSFELREALCAQLEAAIAAFESPSPVEAVHRGRTSLKRARALARLAHLCAPETAGQIISGIRAIMRRFSDVRDLDAIAACAKSYAEQEEGRTRKALFYLSRKVAARRHAMECPSLGEAARDARALAATAQGWPTIADKKHVRAGAERLDRRVRRAFKEAQLTGEVEDRHKWRQREKERLYAALLLGDAWPKKLPRRTQRAQRLGELLGRERDTMMLIAQVRREPALAGAPDDADLVQAFLGKKLKKLRKQTDKIGKDLHR
ncbi:MAG: CHAD domain-containing protein [Hyphomonadaceae bacterium]|nr:CHAD domain-containing protein [Hyphomonadaceae bacterium]